MAPLSPIHMPAPPDVRPERLRELASRYRASSSSLAGPSSATPIWPPRSTWDVLDAALKGTSWSLLELWLALADKDWWDNVRRLGRAAKLAEALWRSASDDSKLANELFHRSALALSGLPARLPPEIAAAGPGAPIDRAWVLQAVQDDDATPIVDWCAKRNPPLAPADLLARMRAPPLLPLMDRIPSAAASALVAAPKAKLDAWTAAILDEARADLQDMAFPHLLEHLTGDQLVELPHVRDSVLRWETRTPVMPPLSATARGRLAALRGVASWDQIIEATESLVGFKVADIPRLVRLTEPDVEQRIARWSLQRVEMWANYASRMTSTKLFVPAAQRGHFLVGGRLPENVEVARVPEPVARLTFPRLVVLQHLTGTEATTFHRTTVATDYAPEALATRNPPFASVKCTGHLWQWHLYQAIERAGLEPNEGLTRFRYLPQHLDPKTGRPRDPAGGNPAWRSGHADGRRGNPRKGRRS